MLEAQQYVLPNKLFVAVRYTNSSNDTDGINGEDTLKRNQLGAGFWINERTLRKAEFDDQDEEANSGGQVGGGFDGFITEISTRYLFSLTDRIPRYSAISEGCDRTSQTTDFLIDQR